MKLWNTTKQWSLARLSSPVATVICTDDKKEATSAPGQRGYVQMCCTLYLYMLDKNQPGIKTHLNLQKVFFLNK